MKSYNKMVYQIEDQKYLLIKKEKKRGRNGKTSSSLEKLRRQ